MTELNVVTVATTNFGEIEVPLEDIIHFGEGIPGFPKIHKFAILEFEQLKPFLYLQSLDEPPIALLIVSPFLLHPSYRVELGDSDLEDLKTRNPEEVAVFAVATIPENPAEATLNLMAPILINQKNRSGKQVILLDSQFSVRHPLFESVQSQGIGTD
jgi:flagellar assembly factor FliW